MIPNQREEEENNDREDDLVFIPFSNPQSQRMTQKKKTVFNPDQTEFHLTQNAVHKKEELSTPQITTYTACYNHALLSPLECLLLEGRSLDGPSVELDVNLVCSRLVDVVLCGVSAVTVISDLDTVDGL